MVVVFFCSPSLFGSELYVIYTFSGTCQAGNHVPFKKSLPKWKVVQQKPGQSNVGKSTHARHMHDIYIYIYSGLITPGYTP